MLALSLGSCNDDDDKTLERTKKAVVTADQTTFTVKEGATAHIVLNVDNPLAYKMDFKLELQSVSTGVEDEDYTVPGTDHSDITWGAEPGYKIEFPAFASTHTIDVKTLVDYPLVDGNKTLVFKLISAGNGLGLVQPTSELITINIEDDSRSSVLGLDFDFDAPFDFGGSTYTTCQIGYDIDIIVYDEAGNDLGIFDGQTGACPEHISVDMATWEDGTYIFKAYVYDNLGLPGLITPAYNIPVNVTYDRPDSTLSGVFNQNASNYLTTSSANGDEAYVMSVKIENANFTIIDGSTEVATGKLANFKHTKKSNKVRTNKKFNF
ncbi:hypothetical protein ABGT15_01760 [Flavobacterium enshiense]|uniref:hypothetical protein n=1 Tax=Flavobacterium enshiense TaxID=1341165 RepID=UPI00345D63AC